jgi:hypothetical protein
MGGSLISSHPVLNTNGGNTMGIRDYLDDKAPIPGFLKNGNGEEPPRPIPSLEQQKYIPGRQKADKPPADLATKMEDELRTITSNKRPTMAVVEPTNMNHTSVESIEPLPAYNPAPSVYEENPLYETARWMLLLTFNDFISLATKIVKKEGYTPPTTPFELANLMNDWAISECREHKP